MLLWHLKHVLTQSSEVRLGGMTGWRERCAKEVDCCGNEYEMLIDWRGMSGVAR